MRKAIGTSLATTSMLVLPVGAALAAVPEEVTDMYTSLATDFGVVFAASVTLVVLVFGSFLVLDWAKKGGRKAK